MGILLHNPGVSFFDICNFIVTHEDLLILLVFIPVACGHYSGNASAQYVWMAYCINMTNNTLSFTGQFCLVFI